MSAKKTTHVQQSSDATRMTTPRGRSVAAHRVCGVWTGREVSVRELRNPGPAVRELVESGETARVTSGGELVAWLVPASPEERRREELIEQGKLRPGRPGGLAGRGPMPRQEAGRPLSEALAQMRDEETR